ncbi:MAG: hypothetical protein KDC71_13010 [Acidobacteria bacterium]|nr:hypothetical protein [Acidobacteriota bacterium]
MLALDRALTTFQAINPRQAQVAEMKIFSKVDEKTLAEMLNVSLATVQRDWKIARAWLNQHAPQYLGD